MSELITDRKLADIILAAIGSKDEPIKDMARLNCMMFDSIKIFKDLERYCTFVPSEHGPHCAFLYQMVDQLRTDGLVAPNELALTELGKKRRDEILTLYNDDFSTFDRYPSLNRFRRLDIHIDNNHEHWNNMTDDEFHTWLYYNNSEFTTKHEIYNRLKPHMKEIITQMTMDGKMSIGFFARLLKIHYEDAFDILYKRGYFNVSKSNS